MKTLTSLELVRQSLSTASKTIIFLGPNPNFDAVASALSLHLSLKEKGIASQVVSASDMRVEFSRLVGVDEVKKKLGNKNLIVSFAYEESRVEKVSYAISEDRSRFNLVIAPKSGALPLDPASVDFDLAGIEADLIFLVGISSFQEIGEYYDTERNVYDTAMTVALTLFPVQGFVKSHADASGMSSLSELTSSVIQQLDLPLNQDGATNLLAGIDLTTQGFRSPLANAEMFEAVARLMKAGAVRLPPPETQTLRPTQMPFMPQSHPANPFPFIPPSGSSSSSFAAALGGTGGAPQMMQQPIPSEMKG